MLLVLFAVLELSLRIHEQYDPAFYVVPDTTYLKYRGRPHSYEFNSFRINAHGFKDADFTEKIPGRFRIIALGDSQTYGAVPYPDAYMTLVVNNLRSAGAECEILNLGVPSAGPVDYLSVFLNEGLDLKPDLVLLNFNIYDDFKNGGKRFKFYSYSKAASYINNIIATRFGAQGRIFGSGRYREGISLRSDESYVRLVTEAHEGVFRKRNDRFREDFRSAFGYVKTIKKICDAKKIALAVVIIPADLQLYAGLQRKVMAAQRTRCEDYDFRRPNRILARECLKLHIEFIDILDGLRRAHAIDGKSLTQGNDPHWTLHGSAVAAEEVSPWLLRQVRSVRKTGN